MTRRSFITDLLKCGIATTFLPGAGRIWKPTYALLTVPNNVEALNLNELVDLVWKITERRREFSENSYYRIFHLVDNEICRQMGLVMRMPAPDWNA